MTVCADRVAPASSNPRRMRAMTCMLAQTLPVHAETTLLVRMNCNVMLEAHRRVVIEDAAATLAEQQLAAMPQILKKLRTQHDLTSPAPPVRPPRNRHAR